MKLQRSDFEVRIEELSLNLEIDLKILFLSDLHFRNSSTELSNNIFYYCKHKSPDFILLGGDYVESKSGLIVFEELIKRLSPLGKVIVIPGNHDYFFGIDKLKSIVEKSECVWLEKSYLLTSIKNVSIQIDGNFQSNNLKGAVNILCIHNPSQFKTIDTNYDVAFAGHLHGGQIVLWKHDDLLYPGAFFYEWNGLRFIKNGVPIYISKGLGDTIPIRYNCAREIIELNISGKYSKNKT